MRAVQEDLLRLAQRAAGSPFAGARLDQVTFAEGRIRRDDRREMSIADAMRAGKVDRIEKEASAKPNDSKYAHSTHSARGAGVPVADILVGVLEQIGVRHIFGLIGDCERRSNNPSLKRPVFRLRRSKNPAADGPLPRIGEGRGDEERGAIWTGALCGPD